MAERSRPPRAAIAVTGAAGSGKTKLAAVLAETLYPGENALLRFDMREYSDYSAISTLTGSPAGSVSGGRLTEAVRRKPFAVVLLTTFNTQTLPCVRLFKASCGAAF